MNIDSREKKLKICKHQNSAVPQEQLPPDPKAQDSAIATVHELRNSAVKDLLDTLQLVLSDADRKQSFPTRFEDFIQANDPKLPRRFKLQKDYAEHLESTMSLASNLLNDLLQAGGRCRTFSFSHSYFDKCSFADLVHSDWVAKTVASTLEKRLLGRIQIASDAIHILLGDARTLLERSASNPTSQSLDDSSTSARYTRERAAQANARRPVSPREEDNEWAAQVQEEVR